MKHCGMLSPVSDRLMTDRYVAKDESGFGNKIGRAQFRVCGDATARLLGNDETIPADRKTTTRG